MAQACRERGLKPQQREISKDLKSSDGNVVYATESCVCPVGICSACVGQLHVAYVGGD